MDELFEELFGDIVPTLFRADIKFLPDRLLATAKIGNGVLDVIATGYGKDKADEFEKYVDDAINKHDLNGLLTGIVGEFNRIIGVKNTVMIDHKALREQLDEDE